MRRACNCGDANKPRKEHEVEAVGSVPLSFVESRPLLHQVLQVSGVHLQPSDHVIHVAFIVLVMNFTDGQRQREIEKRKQVNKTGLGKKRSKNINRNRRPVETGAYPMIFPRQFSTFLKSGLFSGSSSQQLCISMYTLTETDTMSDELQSQKKLLKHSALAHLRFFL